MRSTPDERPDDRTTRARIRDAAIACFASEGVAGTTARKVAGLAGVSPALVIHHFGSMEGLRSACDDHVVAAIRGVKREAMAAGPGIDLVGTLRRTDIGPVVGYVSGMLVEDSPGAARLVDDLVADAVEYLEEGVASGMLRPSADPRARAALLALWSLGALALHHHMRRLLGVDLTDPGVMADPAIANYLRPVYEVFGNGLFTEAAAARLEEAAASMQEPSTTKGTR